MAEFPTVREEIRQEFGSSTVAEFPTVGEEIREEFGSNRLLASTDIDVSKDMVANVVGTNLGPAWCWLAQVSM